MKDCMKHWLCLNSGVAVDVGLFCRQLMSLSCTASWPIHGRLPMQSTKPWKQMNLNILHGRQYPSIHCTISKWIEKWRKQRFLFLWQSFESYHRHENLLLNGCLAMYVCMLVCLVRKTYVILITIIYTAFTGSLRPSQGVAKVGQCLRGFQHIDWDSTIVVMICWSESVCYGKLILYLIYTAFS